MQDEVRHKGIKSVDTTNAQDACLQNSFHTGHVA